MFLKSSSVYAEKKIWSTNTVGDISSQLYSRNSLTRSFNGVANCSLVTTVCLSHCRTNRHEVWAAAGSTLFTGHLRVKVLTDWLRLSEDVWLPCITRCAPTRLSSSRAAEGRMEETPSKLDDYDSPNYRVQWNPFGSWTLRIALVCSDSRNWRRRNKGKEEKDKDKREKEEKNKQVDSKEKEK